MSDATISTERKLDVGRGFVRARECPDCGHTRCGEDCVCNCDAAHAEHEAARLRHDLEFVLMLLGWNGVWPDDESAVDIAARLLGDRGNG